MKIAIIIEDVNKIAGQERVIAELVTRLVARHEVHLFCYEARDIPPQVIVHKLRQPPVRFFMARALCIVIASLFAVRPRDFDIVLSQGGNALNQTHTLVHGCLARRWGLTRSKYWRLKPPSPSELLIRTLWYRIVVSLERRAVRRCRDGRTLAVSHELAQLLSRYHGVPPEQIAVCENGLDHERFRPDPDDPARATLRAQMGLDGSDVLALFLGGIWLEKGATYSIEALAKTPPQVHLCLAGRDDPAPFRALAERLGVADRLHFLPGTDRPWDYYHAADLFLFPGHAEGFGLVAVEAAACGLPVLMTRIGVAERLIQDGVSGYLIEQDPAQIAARLTVLAASPTLRQTMGQAAHEASLQFTWDRQAAEIEAAFERIE
ncbi:MAG: glycosyltransferase family 4 protein [Armatimonadota bacterium]